MTRASRTFLQAALMVGGAVAGLGCGGPKAYVRPGFLAHPPRRVAVLPFVISYAYDLTDGQPIPSSHLIGREIFRKTFYHALTPLGYADIKLAEADEKLTAAWGPIDAGRWRDVEPSALGEALGCDALIYGDISRLIHFSTPLYTETSLEASLRMVEAASGEVLWRKQVRVAERGGALVKKGQVIDFLTDQVLSFNPGVKFLRVSDIAVRRLLSDFPNPPMSAEALAEQRARSEQARGAVRLAVLPLDVKRKQWSKQVAALRTGLTSNLQDGPFEVLELQQVDATLKGLGWKEGEPVPVAIPLTELAQALGADALLRGTLTDWGRTYLVVESWVTAGLSLQLIDGASGEAIWSCQKKNRRQAGILKGPTGYSSIATAPIMGLRRSNLERVATDLARSMASDLGASAAVRAYVSEREPQEKKP